MRWADVASALTIFTLGAACLIARDIDAHTAFPVLAGYTGMAIGGGWFACLIVTRTKPEPPRNIRKSNNLNRNRNQK
jgi:hypothetical protein